MAIDISSVSFQQILDKAESELRTLAQSRAEVQAELAAIEAESHTLQAQRDERRVTLRTAEATANARQDDLSRLKVQVTVREGTLSPSVSDELQRSILELERAKAELRTIQERHDLEEARDLQLVDQREASCFFFYGRLREIDAQIKATQTVKQDAQEHLGQSIFLNAASRLDTVSKRIAATEEELSNLRQERKTMLAGCLQDLAAWPVLVNELASMVPYEDDTTHLLEAYLRFIGKAVLLPRGWDIDRAFVNQVYGGPLLELMALSYFELGSTETLVERFERVSKVLSAYSTDARQRQV